MPRRPLRRPLPAVPSEMAAAPTVKETRQAPAAGAAAPPQRAKNNVVPPGAVRGTRPAKKARSAGKPAKPASTISAPAKAAAPVMHATPPAAPAHAAAAKSAPPATKVAPPTGRPQAPAKSAKPHAPAHAGMPAPAAAQQAKTAKPADRKATIDSRPAPAMDSTQTLHALAPLDLAEDDASRWFVVQLELSQNEIDPEHVPSLDIFDAYRLYTVMGLIDGKLMHALRLGFFNDDISAQAVGAYLKSFFEAPAIKRVSSAERERFAERQVVPRKDVGATGMHSVIEMSSPRPVPEKRLADLAESSSQRAPRREVDLVTPGRAAQTLERDWNFPHPCPRVELRGYGRHRTARKRIAPGRRLSMQRRTDGRAIHRAASKLFHCLCTPRQLRLSGTRCIVRTRGRIDSARRAR